MHVHRHLRWIVGLAGAAGLIAGCSSAGTSSGSVATGAKGPYKVLVIMPLSGPLQPYGQGDLNAIQAAANVVNGDGGILGEKVELTVKDDQGSTTQAVSVVEQALSSGAKYDFVVDGATSAEAVAMAPVLASFKVFNCTPGGAAVLDNPQKYPYLFDAQKKANDDAAGVVSYLRSKSYTNIGFLYPNNELGLNNLDAMQPAWKAAGITDNSAEFDPTAVSLTAPLAQLEAKHPQALILDGYGPFATVELSSLRDLGWSVPVIADPVFGANNLSSVSPSELAKITYVTLGVDVKGTKITNSSAFQTFSKALPASATALGFNAEPFAGTYSCLLIARAGSDGTKSVDPQQVASFLQTHVHSASDIPGWFMTSNINYSPATHFPDYTSNDYLAVPGGPRVDMLLTPSSS